MFVFFLYKTIKKEYDIPVPQYSIDTQQGGKPL